jgi:hypothetical protein
MSFTTFPFNNGFPSLSLRIVRLVFWNSHISAHLRFF